MIRTNKDNHDEDDPYYSTVGNFIDQFKNHQNDNETPDKKTSIMHQTLKATVGSSNANISSTHQLTKSQGKKLNK